MLPAFLTRHGAGLQNMEDRLSALGGNVEVRSRPGDGTIVEGWIPVGTESTPGAPPEPPADEERTVAEEIAPAARA